MTGRNNKPDNDGIASSPSRLDQFGDTLASHNEDEFRSAAKQVLDSGEACESESEEEATE